jgi:murein DD-endopeptidase MepM/ murein hydrolase activator NlpD
VVCAVLLALAFPAAAASHTDAGWQVSLRWPAEGTITSPFGRDGARWHPGLDIGILRSLDVRAAADGVVTSAGFAQGYEGYGNLVVVALLYGYSTLYAHLSGHSSTPVRSCTRASSSVRRAAQAGAQACTSISSFGTGTFRLTRPS